MTARFSSLRAQDLLLTLSRFSLQGRLNTEIGSGVPRACYVLFEIHDRLQPHLFIGKALQKTYGVAGYLWQP